MLPVIPYSSKKESANLFSKGIYRQILSSWASKITVRQAQDKYDYLVLEQRTSEQRFGLDIEHKEGQAIENNLTCDDFELDTAGYLKASNLDEIAVPWSSSLQIAHALTQPPVRLALALSLLLPKR
ncbi:MAG: hypothetical protein HRU41_34740 [Saprospiraceae bacterium]|nr:hypothetical protein [Saprospiraceae bacterium]